MDNFDFKQKLNDLGIPEDKLDDVMELIIANQQKESQPAPTVSLEDRIESIKNEIKNQTDWRVKATLAAKIISLRFDDLA